MIRIRKVFQNETHGTVKFQPTICFFQSVMAVISMVIIRFYKIDGKLYKDILTELEQRNTAN